MLSNATLHAITAAAAIACKITFDKVFGYKGGSNVVVNVTESI